MFYIHFVIRSSHVLFSYTPVINFPFFFAVKNLGYANLREISLLLWHKTKSKPTIIWKKNTPRGFIKDFKKDFKKDFEVDPRSFLEVYQPKKKWTIKEQVA